LRQRRPFNIAVAAVADKLPEFLWARLARGKAYHAGA
jgi:hypothetical protein